MITKKVESGQTLVLYSSIKEMPIRLHNLTQRYLLQDMGIGSDMASIDSHFATLDAYLLAGKLDEAKQERENQRFAFYTMLQEVNYKSLAFACHIFSVDGIEITDRSEDALTDLINSLEINIDTVDEILSEVKKNFNMN